MYRDFEQCLPRVKLFLWRVCVDDGRLVLAILDASLFHETLEVGEV